MQAAVDVESNGATVGTLQLTWYYTLATVGGRTTAATDTVTLPKGKTEVSSTYSHVFSGVGVYWGVSVATSPAAATGQNSTATVLVARCEIQ